ncbi:hypothetical protein Nepgr_033709 [Nepenthes gracilis]|uniref:Uncharacterized protein n=1 Tax=Nepenthes gracilis TaxID=150966 RepID=A0AAD3TKX4_NEPGR|nr:hypothetical protein Nepgr_033709 [Nepenthes gracilis]
MNESGSPLFEAVSSGFTAALSLVLQFRSVIARDPGCVVVSSRSLMKPRRCNALSALYRIERYDARGLEVPPCLGWSLCFPPLTSAQSDSLESVLGLGGLSSSSTLSSPVLAPVLAVPSVAPRCFNLQGFDIHVLDPADSVGGTPPISASNGDADWSVSVCCPAEPPPLSTALPSGSVVNMVAKEPMGGFGPLVCDRIHCLSGPIASLDDSQNHLYPPSQSKLHPAPLPSVSADVHRAGSASSLPVVNGAGHSVARQGTTKKCSIPETKKAPSSAVEHSKEQHKRNLNVEAKAYRNTPNPNVGNACIRWINKATQIQMIPQPNK